MDEAHDTRIVARILDGDRQAYALLVEEYKAPIYNLAYRMTGDQQDAADLTQDVFIRAYTYLWRYNPRQKFFTWLYTIALNTIKNHIKKNKQYKNARFPDLKERQYSENQKSSEAQDINIYLSGLDVETRALIIMKYIQELSFEEIAQITGKSISAVKMRVYRGLDKLKEMLEK
jgi:RNA polymerase sigma-70 factor (ECF subfamily)